MNKKGFWSSVKKDALDEESWKTGLAFLSIVGIGVAIVLFFTWLAVQMGDIILFPVGFIIAIVSVFLIKEAVDYYSVENIEKREEGIKRE